jgi:hypothetical protein
MGRNVLIAWNNLSDAGTYTGGTWTTALPVTNLSVDSLSHVARTSGISTGITQFTSDLGGTRLIYLIGLIAHNMTPDALIRITAANDPLFATTEYQTAWLDVVPVVWGSGNGGLWGVDGVWTGKYLATDLEGINKNFWHVPTTPVLARYWKVEMDDTLNGAGFLDIGRLFIGPAWVPTYNFDVGAKLRWEDPSVISKGLDGVNFVEARTKIRVFKFSLSSLGKDEAMAQAFETQRRQGKTGQVVILPYPDETTHQFRESFLGTIRELSPVEIRQAGFHDTGFAIEEVIG